VNDLTQFIMDRANVGSPHLDAASDARMKLRGTIAALSKLTASGSKVSLYAIEPAGQGQVKLVPVSIP